MTYPTLTTKELNKVLSAPDLETVHGLLCSKLLPDLSEEQVITLTGISRLEDVPFAFDKADLIKANYTKFLESYKKAVPHTLLVDIDDPQNIDVRFLIHLMNILDKDLLVEFEKARHRFNSKPESVLVTNQQTILALLDKREQRLFELHNLTDIALIRAEMAAQNAGNTTLMADYQAEFERRDAIQAAKQKAHDLANTPTWHGDLASVQTQATSPSTGRIDHTSWSDKYPLGHSLAMFEDSKQPLKQAFNEEGIPVPSGDDLLARLGR